MYDSKIARFLQEDTYAGDASDPLSLNTYTYCLNNPIIYIDPTGHWQESDKNLNQDARIAISRLTDIYYSTNDPKVKAQCAAEAQAVRSNPDNKSTKAQNSAVGVAYDAELKKDGKVTGSDWLKISNTIDNKTTQSTIKSINDAVKSTPSFAVAAIVSININSITCGLDTKKSTNVIESNKIVTNSNMGITAGAAFVKPLPPGTKIEIPKVPGFKDVPVEKPSASPGLNPIVFNPLTAAISAFVLIVTWPANTGGGELTAQEKQKIKAEEKAKEDAKRTTISDAEKNKNNDTIIYRWGSDSRTNLTPKAKDINGLSFSLTPPASGSYCATTIGLVSSTGYLIAVVDGNNHVSVKPTDPSTMPDWIASRPTAETEPHIYTATLRDVVIRMK